MFDYNVFGSDGYLCESLLNMESIFKEAHSLQAKVERPKRFFKLGSSNHPGLPRGEIDIQVQLVPVAYALKKPVGPARDRPNEEPFLPDPVRETKGFFDSPIFKFIRYIIILGVLIGIILAIVVSSQPPSGTAATA